MLIVYFTSLPFKTKKLKCRERDYPIKNKKVSGKLVNESTDYKYTRDS